MKKSLLILALVLVGCQPATFKFNGCTVTKVTDGTLVTCSDGSSQLVHNGGTGVAGPQGSAGSNGTNGTNGVTGTNGSNGVNGTNGTNGRNTLISSVAATTSQCPTGGSVLSIGIDLNNNSKLETTEITDKIVLCNGKNGDDNSDCDRD